MSDAREKAVEKLAIELWCAVNHGTEDEFLRVTESVRDGYRERASATMRAFGLVAIEPAMQAAVESARAGWADAVRAYSATGDNEQKVRAETYLNMKEKALADAVLEQLRGER